MIGRRIALLFSSWAGVFVTAVLTVAHWSHRIVPCGSNSGGCEKVAHDPWARLGGIPIAAFGLGAHLLVGVAAIAIAFVPGLLKGRKIAAVTGLAIMSTLVSTLLTWHSSKDVGALCNWCVASGILFSISTVLLISLQISEKPISESYAPAKAALMAPFLACLGFFIQFAISSSPGQTANPEAVSELRLWDSIPSRSNSRRPRAPSSHEVGVKGSLLLGAARHTEGSADAGYTVVMFGDFDCPANHTAFHPMRELCRKSGARFVFRNFPLPSHTDSPRLAKLAEMAPNEAKYWEIAEKFMSGETSDPETIASDIYNLEKFKLYRRLQDDEDPATKVFEEDLALDKKLGFHQTPMFIVFSSNAKPKTMLFEDIFKLLEKKGLMLYTGTPA